MTDSSAGAQQDIGRAAQPEATQDHPAKRRSPPPSMQRVVAKKIDALALQTDKPTANDGTHHSVDSRKRAHADRDIESSSDTEKEQARVAKQRRKRQSTESTLNHLVEWSRESHQALSKLEQDHKILKDSREAHEGEFTKLKEGFADLLEATIVYNTRLDEDRGRYQSYDAQANKDRIFVEDLATRIQKQEDDIAARLQRIPTSQEVTDIIAEERKAREKAMELSVDQLKTIFVNFLTPATDRIDKVDQTLDAYQKQSDTLTSKVEGAVDHCDRQATETATVLSALQTQINQAARASDIQEHVTIERKAREKALSDLPGQWTVGANTLINARVASLVSKFETTTIPEALEPLQSAMDSLRESHSQDLGDLKASVAEMQKKSHVDYDRAVKETQSKVDALKTTYAKETARQDHAINSLRKDLSIEREKRAESEKLDSQAVLSRAEDEQKMSRAMEAQKDHFARRLEEMEAGYKGALEAGIQSLRAELRATIKNEDTRAREVEALRRRVVKVEAESSQESETRKATINRVREDVKTLTERVDNLSDAIGEARAHNISESRTQSKSILNTVSSHLRTELHTSQPETAAQEAVQAKPSGNPTSVRMDSPQDVIQAPDFNEIHERLNKLGSSGPIGYHHQTADVAKTSRDLKRLASWVTALQRRIDECSDIVKPMSADVDLLKRQRADHVNDCEAKVREQAEATKARIDLIKKQLQHRIDDNLDLQSHFHNGYRQTDSPQPMRAFTSPGDQGVISHAPEITEMKQLCASLKAQVDKLSKAEDVWDLGELPLRLTTWASRICSDLDECKRCVADDLTTLLAYVKALEAQYEKHDRDYVNLEAQVRILRANMLNRGS